MSLKEELKFMFHLFCAITAFETIYMAIAAFVNGEGFTFTARDLYKIPLVALFGVIPVLILVRKEQVPKTELILRRILHFIITAAVVLGSLVYFGWLVVANAIVIIVFFLAIYIGAYVVESVREKQLADKINERINAFHEAENATHRNEP